MLSRKGEKVMLAHVSQYALERASGCVCSLKTERGNILFSMAENLYMQEKRSVSLVLHPICSRTEWGVKLFSL